MEQPPGFVFADQTEYALLLYKSLYGLRQASHCWYQEFNDAMLDYGFKRSTIDPCLYLLYSATGALLLVYAIYVDDGILTGPDENVAREFSQWLWTRFRMEYRGVLRWFLGVNVRYVRDRIVLSQERYLRELITRYNFDGLKRRTTPGPHGGWLEAGGKAISPAWRTIYRSAVGAALFLTLTRDDIGHAVLQLCRFVNDPRLPHWRRLVWLYGYLNTNVDWGIAFGGVADDIANHLIAASDSDFGGCTAPIEVRPRCPCCSQDDCVVAGEVGRRSVTGAYVFLNGGPIISDGLLQSCVTRSTCVAEFQAMGHAVAKVMGAKHILAELGYAQSHAPVFVDNSSARTVTERLALSNKLKHVDLWYNYSRERHFLGDVAILEIASEDNPADFKTKLHTSERHAYLRALVMYQFESSN